MGKILMISLFMVVFVAMLLVAGCVNTNTSDDQSSNNTGQLDDETPPAPPAEDDDQLPALPEDDGSS